MDRPQLIRRLRIVASVFFAVLTVVLCMLWVRSYKHIDRIVLTAATVPAASVASDMGLVVVKCTWPNPMHKFRCGLESETVVDAWTDTCFPPPIGETFPLTFVVEADRLVTPYWIVVIATIAGPWLKPRFSLRTLLIATTLVAVVLGLVGFPPKSEPVFVRESHPGVARKGFSEDEEESTHDRSDY